MKSFFGFLSWAHSRPGLTLLLPASHLGSLALSYLSYLVCQTSSRDDRFASVWWKVLREFIYSLHGLQCQEAWSIWSFHVLSVSHTVVLGAALTDLLLISPFILAQCLQWLLCSGLLLWGWEGNWHILCKRWVSYPCFKLSHPSKEKSSKSSHLLGRWRC